MPSSGPSRSRSASRRAAGSSRRSSSWKARLRTNKHVPRQRSRNGPARTRDVRQSSRRKFEPRARRGPSSVRGTFAALCRAGVALLRSAAGALASNRRRQRTQACKQQQQRGPMQPHVESRSRELLPGSESDWEAEEATNDPQSNLVVWMTGSHHLTCSGVMTRVRAHSRSTVTRCAHHFQVQQSR